MPEIYISDNLNENVVIQYLYHSRGNLKIIKKTFLVADVFYMSKALFIFSIFWTTPSFPYAPYKDL